MVQINFAKREVQCKVVYYGPALSGKTANLRAIHERAPDAVKGVLTTIATDTNRTLFFDFLPLRLGQMAGIETKINLYAIPYIDKQNATRLLVLEGADGIVFVADSSKSALDANREALLNLRSNLAQIGRDLREVPLVFQWNKKDAPDAMPPSELMAALNPRGVPAFQANALIGEAVFPTLKAITQAVLQDVTAAMAASQAQPVVQPVRQAAPPEPAPEPEPEPAPPPPEPVAEEPPAPAAESADAWGEPEPVTAELEGLEPEPEPEPEPEAPVLAQAFVGRGPAAVRSTLPTREPEPEPEPEPEAELEPELEPADAASWGAPPEDDDFGYGLPATGGMPGEPQMVAVGGPRAAATRLGTDTYGRESSWDTESSDASPARPNLRFQQDGARPAVERRKHRRIADRSHVVPAAQMAVGAALAVVSVVAIGYLVHTLL